MVVKITSSTRPEIYFCIVVVQMESHAGGNQGGMRNMQLIDLEWLNINRNLPYHPHYPGIEKTVCRYV